MVMVVKNASAIANVEYRFIRGLLTVAAVYDRRCVDLRKNRRSQTAATTLPKRIHVKRFIPIRVRIGDAAAARRRHCDVLFPIFRLIRHRNRDRAVVELCHPEFLSGLGVESAKTFIVGGADEYDAAAGCDRAAHVDSAGILFAFRELVGNAKYDLPCNLAGIRVDGRELSPWRLLAGPALFAEQLILCIRFAIPKL